MIARLPRAWKNPAYRRARRLGQAPWHAIADELPAGWIPGDQDASFSWSRS